MLRRVVWYKFANVSEVLFASIIKARSLISLIMESLSTSETSVNFYETTRRNIPEDRHFHALRRENPKSHSIMIICNEDELSVT
jgi:hypothetical protein